MLKSYRAQHSPTMEYWSVHNVSRTWLRDLWGQLWVRMQCGSVPMKLTSKQLSWCSATGNVLFKNIKPE